MEKYYFISYLVKHDNGDCFNHGAINANPIDWVVACNSEYIENDEDDKVILLSFHEISEDRYKRMMGE